MLFWPLILIQCWYAPPTKIFWKYQTFFRPYLKEISDNFQTGQWIFSDFETFFSSNWLKSPLTITNLWIHAWKLHTNSPKCKKAEHLLPQKTYDFKKFCWESGISTLNFHQNIKISGKIWNFRLFSDHYHQIVWNSDFGRNFGPAYQHWMNIILLFIISLLELKW